MDSTRLIGVREGEGQAVGGAIEGTPGSQLGEV